MALKSQTSNPLHDNPCRFIGKLLVLPGRFNNEPVLFTHVCWDDDGNGFDGFFLTGKEIKNHYFCRRTFFQYCCVAEEFYQTV